MAQIQDLKVKINLDTANFDKGIKGIEKSTNSMSDTIKKVGGVIAAAFTTKKILEVGKDLLDTAASAEEMRNKFSVVFKETGKSVENWASTLGGAIGRSKYEIMGAVGDMADLAIGMGMTEVEAGSLSQQFIELAYDLASFNNKQDSFAIEAMTKALMGETEQMKSLGVNLSVAVMEENEYVKSLGKKWSELTMTEKAQAYYNETLKQSTNAIGDAERSAGSFTNQQKALSGATEELKVMLGEKLLPLFTPLVTAMADFVGWITDGVDRFFQFKEQGNSVVDSLKQALITMGLGDWAIFINTIQEMIDKFKETWEQITQNDTVMTLLGITVGTITAAILAFNAAAILASASMVAQEVILWAMIAAETVATVATTAFGVAVAFLTSPITLVILAIGAIIAIIYLLATNWDMIAAKTLEIWENIKTWVKTKTEEIKNNIKNWIEDTKTKIKDGFEKAKQTVIEKFEAIKKSITDKINSIKQGISDWVQSIKDKFKQGFEDAKATVLGTFDKIKQGIKDKIDAAKQGVHDAIQKIKDFFNFEWSLPKIKLPHFSIQGQFSLNPPSIPSFGVDWYSSGGIFTKKTVLPGGVGVGDAINGGGNAMEAVLPIDRLPSLLGLDQRQEVVAQTANIFVELDGRVLAKSVGANLVDTVRIKTGLSL